MRLIQPALGLIIFFFQRIGRFPGVRMICIRRRYRPPALELLSSRIGALHLYGKR